ncbi:MAG: (2Fe-2S)-binding protein [Acidobacteria bacterium]|nr:(2Fe-2S)-binding protein [Acidobacteriota bacterium]
MYACVCNAVRESEVKEARDQGCRTPEQALARCGGRLECGACVRDLRRLLSAQDAAEEAVVGGLKAS